MGKSHSPCQTTGKGLTNFFLLCNNNSGFLYESARFTGISRCKIVIDNLDQITKIEIEKRKQNEITTLQLKAQYHEGKLGLQDDLVEGISIFWPSKSKPLQSQHTITTWEERPLSIHIAHKTTETQD